MNPFRFPWLVFARMAALVFVAVVTAGACSAEIGPPPKVTSGQCFRENIACMDNAECCSNWCVNGYCAQRQP
jgi:hypothetical protein